LQKRCSQSSTSEDIKAFDNVAIREFYSHLRATIMGAKNVGLLKTTLSIIIGRMLVTDWKQWAIEKPNWIQGTVEQAIEKLLERYVEGASGRTCRIQLIYAGTEENHAIH
jgi:hypothetical protein